MGCSSMSSTKKVTKCPLLLQSDLWNQGERRKIVKKGVSGKTHTKQQLDDYANQKNPNNKAYKANQVNASKHPKQNNNKKHCQFDNVADLEWFCYGWIDD